MRHSSLLLSLTILVLSLLTSAVNSQTLSLPPKAPVLFLTTEGAVAPGTAIGFGIFWGYGIPENSARVLFVFLQNGRKMATPSTGGGGEQDTGSQTFNVTVPEGLAPGLCRVVAQFDQLKSEPIELEITGSVPAPMVTSEYAQVNSVSQYSPRPAQPGDIASVEGSNFSQSDEVEIIDSQGVVHRAPVGSTSSAFSTCFRVPQNSADGDATFEIVEQRSGLRQRSRKISMRILNVPLPLEIRSSETRPVAPGQWIDIGFVGVPPYDQPTRIEVAFEQNEHTDVIELQLEPNDDLHVHVPSTLLPGEVVVRTRTLRDGRASEWSQAAHLELLDQPAPPFVESVQRRRIREQQSEPLLHLENDRSSAFIAAPGDWIAIWGNFAVESTSSLRVTLVKGGRKVVIKPLSTERPYPTFFEVELPRDLRAGEWEVLIGEEVHNTSAKLKLTLRVH